MIEWGIQGELMTEKIYQGNIITSKSFDELEIIEDGYVCVKDGIITDVSKEWKKEKQDHEFIDHRGHLILPAFSDLHMHAPQYPQRGIGMDCLLFDWLNNYTFPQESNFRDVVIECSSKQEASKHIENISNGSRMGD